MKKLSIITINLNNASGVKKTIESVVCQIFNDYEFIIIDGVSTDGSVDVIKKFETKINYWISETDTGIYNAMNKGIKNATGEYCLFLNSGDYLLNEDVLNECFNYNFDTDFVYGHQLKEENGIMVDDRCLDEDYISFLTLKNDFVPHQCTFIKRELFNRIGLYNEENNIISDWEFIMKALFTYNCSIKRIPVKMTVYDTQGISSIEKYKIQQHLDRRNFLYKQFPLIIKDYDDFERFMSKPYIKLILKVRNALNKTLRRVK